MTAELIRIGTTLALLFCLSALSYAGNIAPDGDGHKYAWSENSGWLNFEPSQGPRSTVADDPLTGYVWSENIGWIKLDPDNCNDFGVKNDGSGNLSGWAWGENIGWINFNHSSAAIYGVKTACTYYAVLVPVLNDWGMIILVLFLTGSAVWLLRWKKKII